MRAAVYSRYGPPEVVRILEVDRPVPGPTDVLVRVRATTLCTADWRFRKADPSLSRFISGLFRPTRMPILGMEFAGVVDAVGDDVTRFRVGTSVFGSTGFLTMGTHAEYVSLPESGTIAEKPANASYEEAAAVLYGGVSALHFLGRAAVAPGERVLVYGASGSVGVFAVQLAKHLGAHVTGVCSTKNLDLVRSLGADAVIDYTADDFSTRGRVYDVVFDTVGKSGYGRSVRSLRRGGRYVRVGGSGALSSMLSSMATGWWMSITGAATPVGGVATGGLEALLYLKELIEAGKVRSVIDRSYPLDQIVEAHRYVEAGHKVGGVAIIL